MGSREMSLHRVLVVFLFIQLSLSEENSEVNADGRSGKSIFDWEQQNFGGRTSSKGDALLDRVKVDEDAPKLEQKSSKREGKRNFSRGKHTISIPNRLRSKIPSADEGTKDEGSERARKLRNRIAGIREKILPSRNALSRNLVNVQDNIVKTDNDIEITTRKNVQEVPFILSSRDSEEIGLPFLASTEKKEMISSTSESYEFLPTRSTQNNTKSVIVTEDELSKGNNVTIDSD